MKLDWQGPARLARKKARAMLRRWLDKVMGSGAPQLPPLPDVIEQARRDYRQARYYFESVTDPDLVDYAAFWLRASEKKYIYLLKQARRQGIAYSPYQKAPRRAGGDS